MKSKLHTSSSSLKKLEEELDKLRVNKKKASVHQTLESQDMESIYSSDNEDAYCMKTFSNAKPQFVKP